MRNINTHTIIAAIIAALLFTSCKSLKNMSSKDNSTSTTSTYKKKKRGGVTFVNGINVTPGTATSSTQSTRSGGNKKVTYAPPEVLIPSGFSIEKADWLQLKYAIMLNETVENLLNISLLKTIDTWWGTRYCIGGSTTNCTDCSGFTQVVMREAYGVSVPRIAQDQHDQAQKVELENLREGDLVFFYTGGRDISHVGVYLTNNKFVHASTSNGVMISDLNDSYWQPRYRGAGRFTK